MKWIVLGSSPSAADFWPLVRKENPDATTIVCAGSQALCPDSDYYYANELHKGFESPGLERVKPPTQTVTGRFIWEGVKDVPQGWTPDIILPSRRKAGRDYEPFRNDGEYKQTTITGAMMMQFAVYNGATEVHMIGHEGYRSTDSQQFDEHYPGYSFGNPVWYKKGREHMEGRGFPVFQDVVRLCPEINFFFYGDLTYKIEGENLSVVTDLSSFSFPPASAPVGAGD